MINKIKKKISYLTNIKNFNYIKDVKNFINIILFLRYIITIFVSFLFIYLLIPKTFNYSKRMSFIEKALIKDYNLEILKFSSISYRVLPTPRLNIKETKINFDQGLVEGRSNSLIILLPYLSMYDYENLKIKKIILSDSKITFDINKSKLLPNFIKNISNKLLLTNSSISLKDESNNIINLNKFNFRNKENNFYLNAFFDEIKIILKYIIKEDKDKLIISIPDIGSDTVITFLNTNNLSSTSGNVKSKNLGNNIQFDFKKEKDKSIKITNSFFRNSFVSTTFNGTININPYFNFDLMLDIKNINNLRSVFYQFLLNSKDLIRVNKNLNGKLKINYIKKNYQSNYLNKIDINAFFENGNLILKDSHFEFTDGSVILNSILKDYKGYQYFDFEIISQIINMKKFLKKITVIKKIKTQNLDVKIKGNLNITSKKINFREILLNNNQIIKESEINNLKNSFENLVIKDGIYGFLEKKRINSFLRKISE